ncbi:MAG: prepilin-type N-terminal cleavage/methylation domain-containing protein [Phycisphaerales bacterium]|nr:prepilin-type N-terminal cleavage/methylation domain-containing protein [Phycisphaerales bacterium]
MKCQTAAGHRAGFTIVELCIVIAILAAVVGVIVIGTQMLENATLQRAAGQLRETETAVAGFRARFNALPGDFRAATRYWPATGAVDGDGDTRITGGYASASTPPSTTSFECYNAWHHLALAELLTGQWIGPTTSNPTAAAGRAQRLAIDGLFAALRYDEDANYEHGLPGNYLAVTRLPLCLSRAAYGGAISSSLMMASREPWWRRWGLVPSQAHAALPPPPKGTASASFNEIGLMPSHAAALDAKTDDGQPLSGRVISALPADRTSAARSCPHADGATNAYNVANGRSVCGLWLRLDGD